MTLILRYAAKSDVGLVRRENEDSGFAGRTMLAVADGMGGHAAGELASSTAIATLAELDSEDLSTEDVLTALDDALVTSAERIAQFIQADPSRAGMGTTATVIAWRDGRIAVIHVGDSRAYLLRDGELSQLTHDHTYVQSLVDAGRITAEEARRHPKRNLMLRAIDGNQVPERDLSIREARAGDRYLLCSDGLCGVVEDAAIAGVLTSVPDLTAAVSALVDLALEAGAPDNVTAVVADVVEVADEEAARESALAQAVVVGAAGEQRNRDALPGLSFPDDVGRAAEALRTPAGPAVTGGLAMRGTDRAAAVPEDAAPGSIGAAIGSGDLPVGASPPVSPPDDPQVLDEDAFDRAGAFGDEDLEDDDTRPGWVARHWRGLAWAAAAVTAVLIGLAGFSWWLGSQWFVGAHDGYVTVYQGVPQEVAGVQLSRVASQSALPVASLPYYDQQELGRTLDAGTREEADRIVAALAVKSAACSSDQPPLGCPTPLAGSALAGTGLASTAVAGANP